MLFVVREMYKLLFFPKILHNISAGINNRCAGFYLMRCDGYLADSDYSDFIMYLAKSV